MGKDVVDLYGAARAAKESSGTVWTLSESEDLNANLVRFSEGKGVGEHVNDEVDVLVFGVSGSGIVAVEEEERTLSSGSLVLIPKGARRWTRSLTEGFAYLSIHRRRAPLRLGEYVRRPR